METVSAPRQDIGSPGADGSDPSAFRSPNGGGFARYADVPSILVAGQPGPAAPLVSIVIPTFRRPALLGEAIRSALAQTGFDDFDVIVVDNDAEAGPDSETAALVASLAHPKLSYYRNASNIGSIGNINRTLEIGRGRYVCQLHDDDWLGPHYLARLMARIPADAEFLSAETAIGTESYRPDYPWVRHAGPPKVRRLSRLDAIYAITSIAPALLDHRAVVEVGGHKEGAWPVSDYDLFMALVARGHSYKVPEVLSYYRTTDSVTFTGNVLEQQIAGSLTLKRRTLPEVPPLMGSLYYIESARRQFERMHMMGREVTPFLNGRADRLADWLAEHRAPGAVFRAAMSGVRGLSSLAKQV